MFEFFKRLPRRAGFSPNPSGNPTANVVLRLQLPETSVFEAAAPVASPVVQAGLATNHRERVFAMRIEHLQFCNPKRCRLLAKAGVVTAGDLACCDPAQIAQRYRSVDRATRAIKRLRAAVRLAASVDGMMPRDALVLVSIHRRSVASLARESAAVLHRDLERFSLSTEGQRMVGRRGVPSLRRVKSWVGQCEEMVSHWIGSNPAEASATAS